MKELRQKINEIMESINTISGRQNSQYIDIMLKLNEVKAELHDSQIASEDNRSSDELYEEAKKSVISVGKVSTSYLQRKLGIGYSRASSLVDMLEKGGIIGPANGSRARKVYGDKNK